MPASPARKAAFQILLRVSKENAYATELLHSPLTGSLTESDQRLSMELVFGVLRTQMTLDWLIASQSKIETSRLDLEVLIALRLAAYQLIFLDRIPRHAAIFEAVELVKQAKKRSASGFVNAVLRRVPGNIPRELQNADLSLQFSHPQWLIDRWEQRFGRERLLSLLLHNNQSPNIHFRSNERLSSGTEFEGLLRTQGISARAHALVPDAFELLEGPLHKASSFKNRALVIQDAGSQIISFLLDLQSHDLCLDLCAGVGNKASHMARLKNSTQPVIAVDVHWHRLRRARELHSTQWNEILYVTADGTRGLPFASRFDKILVDAPCSGTGTLQRHPEIRWRLRPDSLGQLSTLQQSLLKTGAACLNSGGTLVYATCSLEPEENEMVVNHFLASHPNFKLSLPKSPWLRCLFNSEHFLHLFPPQSKTDGFFAAVLRRSEHGDSN